MNTLILSGRLTKDAELKYTPQGTPIANFSIAVNDYKGKDADEATYFFECFAFGSRWEKLSSHLTKGKKIIIKGKLVQQTWVNQDGQKRSSVKIQVDELDFCGGSNNQQNGQGAQNAPHQSTTETPSHAIDVDEESIPF